MKQSALALLVASAVITPTLAHALPELVAVTENFKAGTIIVRKAGARPLLRRGCRAGSPIPGRLWTCRETMGGDGLHNSKIHRPLLDTLGEYAP